MSISSVGRELLSNIVDKNTPPPKIQQSPPIEYTRSESHASSSLSDSFEKINFPSNNHLSIPQYNYTTKLSSSTSSLFRRFPLPQKQKIGHRRVNEHGQVTFKTIETSQICESLQLGIRNSVGRSSQPERDVLMKDFLDVQITNFPAEGSSSSPAHKYDDFRFKTYAPNAFRYFRELFGIPTDDYLMSVGHKQLRELSNPGASGSVFYKTMDDRFIIKTVQQKESHFLRKLLPKYFMNLHQNPDTLLPKFYGLYCYICGLHRIRIVVMNNLLPSKIRVDLKFDLKGSSYKRKASKNELNKTCPTLKDLDFVDLHPKGIYLEPATYDSLMKTIKRDCTVLESFNIMDYSFLIGLHIFDYKDQNKDSGTSTLQSKSDDDDVKKDENRIDDNKIDDNNEINKTVEKEENNQDFCCNEIFKEERISLNQVKIEISQDNVDNVDSGVNLNKESDEEETSFQPESSNSPTEQFNQTQNLLNNQPRLQLTPLLRPNNSFSSISMLDQQFLLNATDQFGNAPGVCTYLPPCLDVIHGRTADGKNLLLFCGIIDILQSYELNKKLEHSFKSIITDGKTISVTRPDYYATRFQDFLGNQVFKKDKTYNLNNKLEINPTLSNNLSFIQRKINTPLINPNFLNITNSQLLTYSILSGSSGGTTTFDNQSNYSYKSSIRSAPPLNSNPFNKALLINNFNKALQDELTFRRNNLTLNSSITKGRLLTRHGYIESLGSAAFDGERSSMFGGSSVFEDTLSIASYSTRSMRAPIKKLSEKDETDDKVNKNDSL